MSTVNTGGIERTRRRELRICGRFPGLIDCRTSTMTARTHALRAQGTSPSRIASAAILLALSQSLGCYESGIDSSTTAGAGSDTAGTSTSGSSSTDASGWSWSEVGGGGASSTHWNTATTSNPSTTSGGTTDSVTTSNEETTTGSGEEEDEDASGNDDESSADTGSTSDAESSDETADAGDEGDDNSTTETASDSTTETSTGDTADDTTTTETNGEAGDEGSSDSSETTGGDSGGDKPKRAWRRFFDGGFNDSAGRLLRLSNGDFILAGTQALGDNSTDKRRPTLRRLDSDGQLIWQRLLTPEELGGDDAWLGYMELGTDEELYFITTGSFGRRIAHVHQYDDAGTQLASHEFPEDVDPIMLALSDSGAPTVFGCDEREEMCTTTRFQRDLSDPQTVQTTVPFSQVDVGHHHTEMLSNGEVITAYPYWDTDLERRYSRIARISLNGDVAWTYNHDSGKDQMLRWLTIGPSGTITVVVQVHGPAPTDDVYQLLQLTSSGEYRGHIDIQGESSTFDEGPPLLIHDHDGDILSFGFRHHRPLLPGSITQASLSMRRFSPDLALKWHLLTEPDLERHESTAFGMLLGPSGDLYTVSGADRPTDWDLVVSKYERDNLRFYLQ